MCTVPHDVTCSTTVYILYCINNLYNLVNVAEAKKSG